MLRTFLQTLIAVALAMGLASCQMRNSPRSPQTRELGSATENGVRVVVRLAESANDHFALSATFIPLESDLHLYSKDIPRNGANGLGRPTLLELSKDTKITVLGGLTESVQAQVPDLEPKDLLVYPPGEVTLSLPIGLPPGACWLDENVSVTYAACSDKGCKPPVIGKKIAVRLPCRDAAIDQ